MQIDLEKIKAKKSMKELLEFSIININKSRGPTSFQNSEFIKKRLRASKTSHFGTLDPAVTGVIPVGINRACKLAGYFLGEDKTYVGIMRMHDEVPMEKIREAIKENFIGEIIQMPPVKSAVKRQLRPRTIYSFDILEKKGKDVLFKVACQGGTYIRTLCVDLGKKLGSEAHMLELRRTDAGIFFEDDAYYPSNTLYEFDKAVEDHNTGNSTALRRMLIPGEVISKIFPVIEIKEKAVRAVFHGSPIHKDEVTERKYLDYKKDDKVVAFSKNKFIGVFKVINEGNMFARSEFTLQPIH
ncbi:MAG: RNA-guided pseudouridylation complex pseudouridine synthase subunit Cbf5 [Nanoarchaeota archaeon]|jgi:H/ACA ribonucleoprotein complex subunit 4|nr:RNA-guided pseudouridylation complex pseudouridine synthase subunit Cbf5 [Nanoarchaeota archaeon]